MSKKILYISPGFPYDTVAHAGGQTLNYYIKKMSAVDDLDVSIVAFSAPAQLKNIDLEQYNISIYPIIKNGGIKDFIGNVFSVNSKFNPYYKYANIMTWYSARLLIQKLKEMKSLGYYPDAIVMEWTQIAIQTKEIKRVFPHAILIASEHDVSFLGFERAAQNVENKCLKSYKNIQAKNMKKRELNALNLCDYIFTHNYKDRDLLRNNGIEAGKADMLIPFYHKSIQPRMRQNNDIIFYGNMKRKENYQAAIWFIDYVMPLVADSDVRFVVVGGSPTEELKARASENVVITGFVDEIDPYFAQAMCFVAPLQLGAGIKIKVLEAMYTGIPVLTNDIGIEGIAAKDGVDYLHCTDAMDYVNAINQIKDGEKNINGKNCVVSNFDMEKSFNYYLSVVIGLMRNRVS